MSVVSTSSSKDSTLSCCGTTKSGEPCKRTRGFPEGEAPETWTCWQHNKVTAKSGNESVTPSPSRSGSPAPAAPEAPEAPATPDRPITKTEPKTPRKPSGKPKSKPVTEDAQPADLLDILNQAAGTTA
jgi:hypothetical protein